MQNEPTATPLVVGVGLAEGGSEPLVEFLRHVDPDLNVCYVVASRGLSSDELRARLSQQVQQRIELASESCQLEPGLVLVVPEGLSLQIDGDNLFEPVAPPPTASAMDDLFRNLSGAFGSRTIIILLSGAGSDGSEAIAGVHAEGGIVLVQHEGSAQFTEMPRHALATGYVDLALTPLELAAEVARLAGHPLSSCDPQNDEFANDPKVLADIFRFVARAAGVDFSGYKATTIRRRLIKRLLMRQASSFEEYYELLRSDPSEVPVLYEELLVDVTELFRDQDVFDGLRQDILPRWLESRATDSLRIWVAGCSRGDEAYSLAIVLLEILRERRQTAWMQIFATDLNESSLVKARAGRYPDAVVENLPECYRRYFMKTPKGYQISKTVRDMCVFARQDVTRDPPFPNLDLISCRNLLIYLGPTLQRRALESMHYALRPGGYLLLGKSESVTRCETLFSTVDKKLKVYRRKGVPTPPLMDLHAPSRTASPSLYPLSTQNVSRDDGYEVQKQADRLILARYAPPGVIINDNLEVVQFRGRTGLYLEPAAGVATHDILKMAREGLLGPLREAVARARESQSPVCIPEIQVRSNGGFRHLNLQVLPIRLFDSREEYLLILFEEARPQAGLSGPPDPALPLPKEESEVLYLRDELLATREYLSSIIQERETANEELKAANEETQSANEELQSANEELETAKEELQSTNEELATINEELHERNLELHRVNGDLNNILTSVDVPVVILDSNQVIRRFTPTARVLLNLIPGDVGRPFNQVRPNLELLELEHHIEQVTESLMPFSFEQTDNQGRLYSIQIRPYRTEDARIDGVVIAFVDVDEKTKATRLAEERHQLNQWLLEQVTSPLLVVDDGQRILEYNSAFFREFAPRPARSGDSPWRLADWGAASELASRLAERCSNDSDFSFTWNTTQASPSAGYQVKVHKQPVANSYHLLVRLEPAQAT
ncbi:MAG: CheR family methyltransferase [Vulcanimicrobiota bacterium]